MRTSFDNTNLLKAESSVVTMKATENTQTNTTEPISTDLLLSLPPELLLPIFSFVGADNFRQDVRRLTVCQTWHAYAKPVLLSSLCLHTKVIGLLPVLRALDGGERLAAVQQLTKHIDLTIRAIDHFPMAPSLPSSTRSALEALSGKLKKFDSLRTLSIHSEAPSRTMPCIMPIQTILSLCTLHQLTSLDLDFSNTICIPTGILHPCEPLSQLIPSLKRLQCRLPVICNEILGSSPGNLEELIISISFRKGDDPRFYPRLCSPKAGQLDHESSYHKVRINLEADLLRFVTSMNAPKTVRLIHNRRFGGHRVFAFDAIQNRRLRLQSSAAWDTDGVVVGEDWLKSARKPKRFIIMTV